MARENGNTRLGFCLPGGRRSSGSADKTKPAKKALQRQHIQFKTMELGLAGVNGTKQQI